MSEIEELFKNKVISFDTKESNTLALMSIKEKIICNRIFIEGVIPKSATDNNWAEGLVASISWDSIVNYMIFDDLQDYISRMEMSEK